jgi:hypothetical protein
MFWTILERFWTILESGGMTAASLVVLVVLAHRLAPAELGSSAVEVPGPETDALCRAGRRGRQGSTSPSGWWSVVERDPRTLGTVYCTALLIGGREGAILGRHRKPKPPTGSAPSGATVPTAPACGSTRGPTRGSAR